MLRADYIAGFFDGEGSVGIYRNGGRVWHLRTQITQNVSAASTDLFQKLVEQFDESHLNMMKSSIYRNGGAFNWQINGFNASRFLEYILPSLRLKREQVLIALVWQNDIHQVPVRDHLGRMVASEKDRPIDIACAQMIKLLKKHDSEEAFQFLELDGLADNIPLLKKIIN